MAKRCTRSLLLETHSGVVRDSIIAVSGFSSMDINQGQAV